MKRVLFYLFYDEQGQVDDYVTHKLKSLKDSIDTIFVVSNSALTVESRKKLENVVDVVYVRENIGFDVWGYKEAMETFGLDKLEEYDELILMNYTFFGPIFPFSETFEKMDAMECDFWGITAHKAMVPNPFTGRDELPLHLNSHWIAVRKKMFTSPEFKQYWREMPMINSYVDSILQHESRFTKHFSDCGFSFQVTFPVEDYPTEYSAFQSIELMFENRSPILKRRPFFHDPIFLEQNAMTLKGVMKKIEEDSDYDTSLIWKNVVRSTQPRTLHTNMDLLEVLPGEDFEELSSKPRRIAVLAHLYYDDMLEEAMSYITNIPYAYDLYITTSDEQKKKNIELALLKYDVNKFEVRVTEENRGRDMGSLFMTLRDVLLSGQYDYLCRVHSKKSPQNGHNMALLFKQHMFDNLLHSPGYVKRVIGLFEKNESLGMVFPPVVHIAYPTLGHAWFENRKPATEWAKKLGITTAFDDSTPVAPYGTMFWFRPEAIKKISTYPFKWSDFDPEPNHMDGGLAHVLERLLGYSVMSDGYHMRCVINTYQASINYTKLEYKLQRLGSMLPNGNIQYQIQWLDKAKDICNRVDHYASANNTYVPPAEWLDQARELHEKLVTFLPGGTFREKMGALDQARLLNDKLNSFMGDSDVLTRLRWVDRAKLSVQRRVLNRLVSLFRGK
ncbi:rhamnan synthesis F family protein [Pseudomonas sp. GM30]|uniref:rhamnan synthesis F family protein n=1 Tax=Pseudomonas sp. GM30 TaxID=1144328 RepID=UPI0002702CD5|nr:rhamnan synthesis F family protein [Pseudomonas sp. GM30]EUB83003.1 Rhamnan synthesis F [Pseudomonas sp. GM30]